MSAESNKPPGTVPLGTAPLARSKRVQCQGAPHPTRVRFLRLQIAPSAARTVNPTCRPPSHVLTNAVPMSPPTPAERFATILHGLSDATAARGLQMLLALIELIIGHLSEIAQGFAGLVATIPAGTAAPRRPQAAVRPRPPGKRPKTFRRTPPDANRFRSQPDDPPQGADMAAPAAPADPPAPPKPRPPASAPRAKPPAIACGPPRPARPGRWPRHAQFIPLSKQ